MRQPKSKILTTPKIAKPKVVKKEAVEALAKTAKELLEDSIKIVQNEISKLTRLSDYKSLLGKDSSKSLTDFIRVLLAVDAVKRKDDEEDESEVANLSREELLVLAKKEILIEKERDNDKQSKKK